METIEGNKLIAEFMGVKYFTEFHGTLCELDQEDGSPWYYDPIAWLDYEKNWSLLMPVVGKINKWHQTSMCKKMDFYLLQQSICSSIEMVWEAVIEFIKWHNDQK